jgi:hypothetical protein
MRVLVVGTLPGAVERASETLRDAGHEVVCCHDGDDAAFPCRGLRGDDCPLDGPGVDVVVSARDHAWPTPSTYEDGAVCALRHRVPMVVHGVTSGHPFDEWVSGESRSDQELPAVVEAVARAPMSGHTDFTRSTARQVLETAGLPTDGLDAAVVRRDGRLRVTLTLPAGAEAAESSVTAKVLGGLRRYDRHARGIDLGFAPR